MKLAFLAVLTALATIGLCDRLVTIPLSIKVPFGQGKFDFYDIPSIGSSRMWVNYGIDRKIELELERQQLTTTSDQWTGGVSYQILPSITDTVPGFSIGFQDLANITPRGRTAYAVFTYRMSNDGELNQDIPTELTIGFWDAHQGLLFFGFSLPFSDAFRIIAEHDGRSLIAGADFRFGPGFGAKIVSDEQKLGLSMSWTGRF